MNWKAIGIGVVVSLVLIFVLKSASLGWLGLIIGAMVTVKIAKISGLGRCAKLGAVTGAVTGILSGVLVGVGFSTLSNIPLIGGLLSGVLTIVAIIVAAVVSLIFGAIGGAAAWLLIKKRW